MASGSGTKNDEGGGVPPRSLSRRATGMPTMLIDLPAEDPSYVDSELVPSSLAPIAPILRVANEIQSQNPRVAYLCRFHAFENAHRMDPRANGRGVRQFKIYLLHKLEKEEVETKPQLARSDPREIQLFYRQFYENNVKEGQYSKTPEEMAKILQIASVLYDVLRTVVPSSKVDDETQRYAKDVERKREQYEHYNILPLYAAGLRPAIMEFPEIKAALSALRNMNNLPMPESTQTHVDGDTPKERAKPPTDILDWLASWFGFQRGNVANQREHLILLIANMDVRKKNLKNYTAIDGQTIKKLMDKILKNYCSWCNYLHRKQNINFPSGSDRLQLQIIYIALYLLIWGEASNIRFMPECICYIFHHMANDVNGILHGNVESVSVEACRTAAPDDEAFLRTVITPIYQVLFKESKRNKGGKESHSKWGNYDDLNEYFWSDRCFSIEWPLNLSSDFFIHSDDVAPANEISNQGNIGKRKPKTNFVEIRTFWHLYRSFDRMWIFFILAFQAMVIVAWSPSGSITAIFDDGVLRRVLSIFVTSSFLHVLQAGLDIVLSFNAWKSLKTMQILRYILKFAVAAMWAVVLPIGYSSSVQNPTGIVKFFRSWSNDWQNQSFYTYAIVIYLIPNILAAVMFVFPPIRRAMERSNFQIINLIMWWSQPKLYVGRGMHEDLFSLLKYTIFWILLLISKLAFSYYVEILPLVGPTKLIMDMHIISYQWHDFFPHLPYNIGVVFAIWSPIVLVYFMDTQIWYAIFSTLFGVIHGAFSHLGEIRTLGMLRARFESVPGALCGHLVPSAKDSKVKDLDEATVRRNIANFSLVWNQFIDSLRMEDLINNDERDLLLVPSSSNDVSVVQWPPFLLASKIPIALDMAKDFKGKEDNYLFRKMDDYMRWAVIECYESLRLIILGLLESEADKEVLAHICYEVEMSIRQSRFLSDFKMSALPMLSKKLEKFLTILKNGDEDQDAYRKLIINVLHDIIEIITQDVMVHGHEILARVHDGKTDDQSSKKEQRFEKINLQLIQSKSWREKVVRLHFLLTTKESAINVPSNFDARRRITFFANSLFMHIPKAPKVRDMLSFSVLTPYYKEDVIYSDEELNKENEDGVTILFYLRTIYRDEWKNFDERINDPKLEYSPKDRTELNTRYWVSFRGQTLARTVRGMMYYKKALELQCLLEDNDISSGIHSMESTEDNKHRAQALADMKFTYVVSCQVYGAMKKSTNPRERGCYRDILTLMLTYPSLRVAYIDVRKETVNGITQKVHYSVLVKGGEKLDEEIYRIKLPGPPTDIGEGKPENQNHAIIFTRGEALQTIDMNQDNYFEEAYKMRNLLEEFRESRRGRQKPTILGLREHIFTGSVSSIAWFMFNQEASFVSIGQRILANPLRVRFHYGHPDVFNRIFHITRGGISKASKIINLSEDIFAGYNSTSRGGRITHHEYIQVGKGRDVGLNQITNFEAKVANGNGEQALSRDVYRLGRCFDFYRMLSFYFTTVGFYFSSMITILTVYVFLYGRLYMVMSGLEEQILTNPSIRQCKALEEALATQSVFQLGLLLVLPMVMEIGLEKGFWTALGDFIIMQLQLASVFFTFQLGTKAHYFGRTILHGGSKYRATGRGFFVYHAKFADNYRQYSRSHFVKGLELVILLVIYEVFGSYRNSSLYWFITFSIWFLVGSWLFAPFVFNPSGFDWQKTVEDWGDWKRWMGNRGGIGIPITKSWESWWDEEQDHLKHTNLRGRICEIVLASRFFIYQYGIIDHLDIARRDKTLLSYGLSWVVMITALLVLKMVSMARRKFIIDFQLMFRILKALLFLGFMLVMTVLFVFGGLTITDVFASILAFTPTGWALLLIGQVLRSPLKAIGFWDLIKELARAYDFVMGVLLFTPVAVLSWFPFVSEFQTRLLFNQAFSRGLQISMILSSKKEGVDAARKEKQ